MDLLQFHSIFLAPGSPKPDTVLLVWFDRYRAVTIITTLLDLTWLVLSHHKGTLLTHIQLLHQFPTYFSTVLLSNHQPVLLPRDDPQQILTFLFAHDGLQEISANPPVQPDEVLLNRIPTLLLSTTLPPFNIIHKLAEDALLPIVQLVNCH